MGRAARGASEQLEEEALFYGDEIDSPLEADAPSKEPLPETEESAKSHVYMNPSPSRLKEVRNSRGDLHCDGGPAIVEADGTRQWYQDGLLHRDDGPAITRPVAIAEAEGLPLEEWYQKGYTHRQGGPAIIYSNKDQIKSSVEKLWLEFGKAHRVDGPAKVWADGSEEWFSRGELHRTDGPAATYKLLGGKQKKIYAVHGQHFSDTTIGRMGWKRAVRAEEKKYKQAVGGIFRR